MDPLSSLLANPSSLGLVFDGCGIAVLGLPAFLRTKADLKREAGTYFDYNRAALENAILFRLDTAAGTVLLVIGFGLQLASNLGMRFTNIIGALVLSFLVIYLLAFWSWFRRWICQKWVSDIISQYHAES